jgi:hypothetical protein
LLGSKEDCGEERLVEVHDHVGEGGRDLVLGSGLDGGAHAGDLLIVGYGVGAAGGDEDIVGVPSFLPHRTQVVLPGLSSIILGGLGRGGEGFREGIRGGGGRGIGDGIRRGGEEAGERAGRWEVG